MQTSAILSRVVDLLKEYPPFQAMEEDDLLGLVARGRVRFHEIDEYVYWQRCRLASRSRVSMRFRETR